PQPAPVLPRATHQPPSVPCRAIRQPPPHPQTAGLSAVGSATPTRGITCQAASEIAQRRTSSPTTCARGELTFQLRMLVQSPRIPVPATAARYTSSSAPQREPNGQKGRAADAATPTEASSHTPALAQREGATGPAPAAGAGVEPEVGAPRSGPGRPTGSVTGRAGA